MATPEAELEARLSALSAQERIILDLIARGYCNKDICRSLGIEVTTTKVHCSHIFKKLGVKNRVQAAVLQLWAILLLERQPLPGRSASTIAGGRRATSMREEPECHSVLQRETST
jgi:DNA-binding CsgD family transcriptional regulator